MTLFGTSLKTALLGGDFSLLKIVLWLSILLFCIVKILHKIFSTQISLERIDKMSGEDFEYYVARLLQRNGFKDVCLTGGSGDFGVDVLANYKKNQYAIQVKRYSSWVGIAAIQEAFSGAKYYETDRAMVITNSCFTDAAVKLAESCNVILVDRENLIMNDWIKYLR